MEKVTTLRDALLKWRPRMLSRRLNKYLKHQASPPRFRNLDSPCMRISTHVDVYEPSEYDKRPFV